MLLPGSDMRDADAVARRFLDLLDVPVLVDGHRLLVRASVGVVDGDPKAAEALLQRADARMYAAKRETQIVLVELSRAARLAHQLTGRVDPPSSMRPPRASCTARLCACSCSRRAAALAWPSGLSGSTPVGSCAFIGSLRTGSLSREGATIPTPVGPNP